MILQGNSIRIPLRDESVHAIVTSFPYYGLRSYGLPPTVWGGDSSCRHIWGEEVIESKRGSKGNKSGLDGTQSVAPDKLSNGQLCQLCGAWLGCFGLEPTIGLHVANAVAVCREIKRVLRRDGVFFLNYGDSYATGKNGRSAADTKAAGKDDRTFRDKPFSVTELPAKNLCMIPARVALALQDDGWILRSEFPWVKGNPMPSSVTDRPGTAHEHVFMLVKSARYYYDGFAVRRGQSKATIERFGNGGTRVNGPKSEAADPKNVLSSMDTPLGILPNGRALRTSDPFFDSLDAYIAHLQDVRDNGGMLVAEWPGEANSEGLPAALAVNTESYAQAHYATFPRKLIAPLIKTTPEKVCPNCGAAWVRITEKIREHGLSETSFPKTEGLDKQNGHKRLHQRIKAARAAGEPHDNPLGGTRTTGWRPTCKCIQQRAPNFGMTGGELLELADEVIKELAPIGGIVLDPFAGSGTVGSVCRELGRRFIGIDLSAVYLAENALARSEKKTSAKLMAQLPMFSEVT